MRVARKIQIVSLVFICLGFYPASLPAAENPGLRRVIGTNEGRIDFIEKTAVDASGNLYIVDSRDHRVQKFDKDGRYQAVYGGYGSGPGKFNAPMGVAVDSLYNIYVADSANNRVQKLDQQGNVVQIMPFSTRTYDIDIDNNENIYVLERNYLSKYSPAGALIWRIGSSTPGSPDYLNANGTGLDRDGNIYVADSYNNRVRKYSAEGVLLLEFPVSDNFAADVAVDSNDLIYVSEHYIWRLEVYDPQGGLLKKIFGEFYVRGVTIDDENNIYLANDQDKVIKMDLAGNQLLTFGSNGSAPGEFGRPTKFAKDETGNVYLVDKSGRPGWYHYTGGAEKLLPDRIRRFDPRGDVTLTFGKNGRAWDQGEFFSGPRDLVVDSFGFIHLIGNEKPYFPPSGWMGTGTLQTFNSAGGFVSAKDANIFETTGTYVSAAAGAIDANNVVLMADDLSRRLIKFFPTGEATSAPTISSFEDIELDGQNNLIALDYWSFMKFDPQGTLLFRRRGTESAAGQISGKGLDVDSRGHIWIADTYNNRVVHYSETGQFISQFGSQGFGPGQFQWPNDVAVTDDSIFVADTYNQRVQLFDLTPDSTPPATALVADPADPDGLNGWYKTTPLVSLIPDETATTFYQWETTAAAWTTYGGQISAPDGRSTLYYYSADTKNNSETVKSRLFSVDTEAPSSPTLAGAAGAANEINLTWSPAGEAGGGPVDYLVYDAQTNELLRATTNTAQSFSDLQYGLPYSYYVRARDKTGNLSVPSNTVTITIPMPTSLAYVGARAGDYSDEVLLAAALTDVNGNPVMFQTVTFILGNQEKTAVTDIFGHAAAGLIVTQSAGLRPLSVEFAGDEYYLASFASDEVSVRKESVTLDYTGDTIKKRFEPVSLNATLSETDTLAGDLSNKAVVFTISDGQNTQSLTGLTDSQGTAEVTTPVNLPAGLYSVSAAFVGDDFYQSSSSANVPFVVWDVIPGLNVNGGGWLNDAGGKANFGFTAKYLSNSLVPQGQFEYASKTSGLNLHSEGFDWLVVTSDKFALLEGAARIGSVGGHQFRLTIADNGTSGKNLDTFSLQLDGLTLISGQIAGGNIIVP